MIKKQINLSAVNTLIICLSAFVLCTSAQTTKRPKPKKKPVTPVLVVNSSGLGMNEQERIQAIEILRQANLAHGGKELDNLKTLRLKGKRRVNDHFFDINILIDIDSQKVREEAKGANNFFSIDQIEEMGGWSYYDKSISRLDVAIRDDLQKILYAGVFGLRSNMLKNVLIKSFADDKSNDQKIIGVEIKGKEYTWIIDSKYRLISQSSNRNSLKKNELFDDFRTVSGINMPHRNVLGSLLVEYENNVLTVNEWKEIEINPVFTENDWAVPESKK